MFSAYRLRSSVSSATRPPRAAQLRAIDSRPVGSKERDTLKAASSRRDRRSTEMSSLEVNVQSALESNDLEKKLSCTSSRWASMRRRRETRSSNTKLLFRLPCCGVTGRHHLSSFRTRTTVSEWPRRMGVGLDTPVDCPPFSAQVTGHLPRQTSQRMLLRRLRMSLILDWMEGS